MGDGLYDALVERHPAAKTMLNREAQIAFETSKGFEAAMDQALQVGSLVITPFLREIARFLISFEQCECRTNGYRRFIAGTRKCIRRTILSTLNYDVLLEWAAYRQSVDFAIDQPPLANRLQILKPHGSAGLLPYLDRNNRITNGVMRGLEGGYVGDMPMRFTFERSRLEEWMGDSSNSSLAPVMSVYAKGKYTPYNQPWVTSHRTLWAK